MLYNTEGKSIVYFIGVRYGLIKIGYSTNFQKRLWTLQCASPVELEVFTWVEAPQSLEAYYHRRFADSRERGEWFKRTPELTQEINRLKGLHRRRGLEDRMAEHRRLLKEWGVTGDAVTRSENVVSIFGPTRWEASHG